MVHPTITVPDERLRQRRFIGVMLAAPFLAAGAAVTLVTSSLGAAVTVAAIFAAFGLCWFAALLVAATGRVALAGQAALAMGGLALTGAIFAAGAWPHRLLCLPWHCRSKPGGSADRGALACGVRYALSQRSCCSPLPVPSCRSGRRKSPPGTGFCRWPGR
ncbi:hypothetical protein AJ88_08390 [Mesorhizobium amorphae CCBAU 01583]|nr:hypothetical protein AJ88_08390 [Mesorhizobium amorphae CCBAU 01583]